MRRFEDLKDSTSHQESLRQGMVTKVFGLYYYVLVGQQTYLCTLRGRLKHGNRVSKNLAVVGDQVIIDLQEKPTAPLENVSIPDVALPDAALPDAVLLDAVIVKVEPRKHCLSRQVPGMRDPKEHIIASHIDQVFIVSSIVDPPLKTGFIDRVLCSTILEEIPAFILINKIDLDAEETYRDYETLYRSLGYPVFCTSVITGEGIQELHQTVQNKLTVLCGYSGVGKSTLINELIGEEVLYIQEISESTHKGVHTTTNAEAVPLPESGYLIDTPGIREFGLYGVDKYSLSTLFSEMLPFIPSCKFGNKCTHIHEPRCAIIARVESGEIHPSRYRSYIHIFQSLDL